MDRRTYLRSSALLAGAAGVLGIDSQDLHGSTPPVQGLARHVFNVRDPEFGARGDASADDTASIQRAIDAAGTAGSNTVFVPSGRYLVRELSLRSGVTLIGAGHTFRDDTGSGTILQARGRDVHHVIDAGNTQFASVQHLKIVGNAPANRNDIIAIECSSNATYLHVLMVSIRYCGGTGVHIRGNVNRVEFLRSRNCAGHIIDHTGSDSHILSSDIGDTDRRNCDGIRVSGHQNTLMANNVFNCRFGIHLDGGNRNRLIGNRCEKNGYYGIKVGSFQNNLIGNQCWNNGPEAATDETLSAGIAVINRSANTIVGNVLFNLATSDDPVQGAGILLHGTRRSPASANIVANNVIRECHRTGIHLERANDNSISANVVQIAKGRNPAFGIHLAEHASNNQLVANNLSRLSRDEFVAIDIGSRGCSDNIVTDNATGGAAVSNRGVRSRINGMVTVPSGIHIDEFLKRGSLDVGTLVYDPQRRRVHVTTDASLIHLG